MYKHSNIKGLNHFLRLRWRKYLFFLVIPLKRQKVKIPYHMRFLYNLFLINVLDSQSWMRLGNHVCVNLQEKYTIL